MFIKSAILWILTLASLLASAQQNDSLISSITVEPIENNRVTIGGLCTNNTPRSKKLTYVLRIQKRSQAGNTNTNNQSGTFYLDPEESKTLSTTTINFEPKDHTEIVLTIFSAANEQIAQHKKWITKADLIKY